jgi:predicted Fe-Mo cluster-binding NifX family protein
MKVAIPVSAGRVSNAFDFAQRLLVVEYEADREVARVEVALQEDTPIGRARRLGLLGVRLLICGAISGSLAVQLVRAGIDVMPFVSGPIPEVLDGFRRGELDAARFLMPGSTADDREAWRKRLSGPMFSRAVRGS